MIHLESISGAWFDIIDAVEALVVVLDRAGRVRLFNRAAERVSGYQREEVLGHSSIDLLVHQAERARMQTMQDRLLTKPTSLSFVNHWITKTNEERLIRWSTTSLGGEFGDPVGLIGTGHDVTHRHALQHDVVHLEEKLRQQFGEELHDMLASHLAGVVMLSSALSRRVEKGGTVDASALHNISDLVQDALEQVRLLSGSFASVELASEDLGTMLLWLAERTEHAADVSVSCSVSDEARSMVSDEETATHLYRIAQEALHNAIRHGAPSQVVLSLTVDDEPAGGKHLKLTVFDDGRGLPDDVTGGVGLKSMRRRAHRIGASFRAERAEEGGTIVECILALSKGQDEGHTAEN